MFNFFMMGGIFMWPMFILLLLVIALSVKKTIELFSRNVADMAKAEQGINAIFFWGSFSFILGILAHFSGIYMAMEAIAAASDISPAIVAKGYAMSLITILFGLVILLLSAVVWFIMRWRIKNLRLAAS